MSKLSLSGLDKTHLEGKKVLVRVDFNVPLNEDGHITESTISNIIFKKDSEYFTPPISCGLLGGTYRAHLINQGHLVERIIPKTEINLYSEIYLINSVRGKYPVKLI